MESAVESVPESALESARSSWSRCDRARDKRISSEIRLGFRDVAGFPGMQSLQKSWNLGVLQRCQPKLHKCNFDIGVKRLEFSIPAIPIRGGTVRQPLGIRHNFSAILVRKGTGNPVLSALPGAQPYRSAARRFEAPKFRTMAKKSTAEYPFPEPHVLKLRLSGENSRVAAIIGSYPAILPLYPHT